MGIPSETSQWATLQLLLQIATVCCMFTLGLESHTMILSHERRLQPQFLGENLGKLHPPSEELTGWQELVEGLSRSSRGDTLLQGDNSTTDEQRVWEIQGSSRNSVSAVRGDLRKMEQRRRCQGV